MGEFTPTITIDCRRHADTIYTAIPREIQPIAGGDTDVPLDVVGEQQANRLPEYAQRPDVVVAATLQRTIQTAQALADAYGLSVLQESRAIERIFGLTVKNAESPDEVIAVRKILGGWWPVEVGARVGAPFPDMETDEQVVRGRMIPALNDLAEAFTGKRLALITSGDVLATTLTYLGALPKDAYSVLDPLGGATVVYRAGATPTTPGKIVEVQGVAGLHLLPALPRPPQRIAQARLNGRRWF